MQDTEQFSQPQGLLKLCSQGPTSNTKLYLVQFQSEVKQ